MGILGRRVARTEPTGGTPDASCPVHTDPAHRSADQSAYQSAGLSAGIGVDRADAEEFLELFHFENPQAGPAAPRLAAVMREIDMTGTYWHTPEELAFGARAA